jgi:hypothetical protein
MDKQHQDVDVVKFLLGLKPEYESVHAQILGGSNLPSLEVFSRIQLPVVVLVVLVEDVLVEVFVVFEVDVILEEVVALAIAGLANALIVSGVIILWSIVGIYIAHHLGLPIRLLLMKSLQLPLDHLLIQSSI